MNCANCREHHADEGPSSPTVASSPFSALSEYHSPSSLLDSYAQSIDVTEKHGYTQSYSTLLISQPSLNEPDSHLNLFPQRMTSTHLPPTRPVDQSDLISESGSSYSANHSTNSHEIAIGLLDAAIAANSASPEKSPRKSPIVSSRKSSDSDPEARDHLARKVARALIAKLVQA